MRQIKIGKVILTDGGAWNAQTAYTKLTYVTYNGDGWWSAKDNVNSAPSKTNTNWIQATDVQSFIEAVKQATTDAEAINAALREAENLRQQAETARVTEEQARVTEENTRKSKEQTRQQQEQQRQSSEATRNTQEQTRETQEAQRQQADTERQQNYERQMASVTTATELAQQKASDAQDAAVLAAEKAALADTAATNAENKATIAHTAAENANTKAQLADQKAGEANTAATNANEKAVIAQTAATNADEKAAIANTAATNADTKAQLADQNAQLANNAAKNANTQAEYAKLEGDKAAVLNDKVTLHTQLIGDIQTQVKSIDSAVTNIVHSTADDSELPTLCGQPPILFGEGTPQEAIVPDNWKQFDPETGEGYNWNGEPSAAGQQYINTSASTGGRYIAVPSADGGLTWKNF